MISAEKIFTYKGHTGAVYALEQGNLPHLFYTGSSDQLIVLWNQLTKEPGEVIAKLPAIVYTLTYYSLKNVLIAGQSQGGIHVINLEHKKEEHFLVFHKGPVFELLILEKHNLLVSAGGDGLLCFISLDDFTLLSTINFGSQKLRSLATNETQDYLFVGCQDGTVSVLNIGERKLTHRFLAHKEGFSVNTLAFLPEQQVLLSGSRDAFLHVYDYAQNLSLLKAIPAHNYAIYHMVLSPDKKWFATASRDKTVKIWNIKTFEMVLRIDLQHFNGHLNSVNRLLWSSFENRLLSTGDDRTAMAWDIKYS